jgi:putative ABC transport system ATP-binding protein
MFRLNREHGTTLVLVTHDASLASRCGRKLSLSAGRLVADQMTAAPRLAAGAA